MSDSLSFEIREFRDAGWLRLTLLGELDMATAPVLEARLADLRTERQAVLMDLSELHFMDSSGLRMMIRSITSASMDGWRFAIDPSLSSQVAQLFAMTNLDQFAGRPHAP